MVSPVKTAHKGIEALLPSGRLWIVRVEVGEPVSYGVPHLPSGDGAPRQVDAQSRAGGERRVRRADASTIPPSAAGQEVSQCGLSIGLAHRLPLAIRGERRQLWERGRSSKSSQVVGLTDDRNGQRRHVHDSRPPPALQAVAVHPAPLHARLRELAVLDATLAAPLGHRSVAAEGYIVADLLVGKKVCERHAGVQLG